MDELEIVEIVLPFADVPLRVAVLSEACAWRARTFYEKEPHTVRWLDRLKIGDRLWDIGANIGLYSMYAARRGADVVAFEPMIPNLYALFCNVGINGLGDRVEIVPAAVGAQNALVDLYVSSAGVGSSCHSAGYPVNFKLQNAKFPARHGAVLIDPSRLPEMWALPSPTHIKIDVDGLEYVVLRGLRDVDLMEGIESMIVELNGNLAEHNEMIGWLKKRGFVHDPAQWEDAKRKEGPFKGVGECIFERTASPARWQSRTSAAEERVFDGAA